jgi:NAD(P)-dependent dehydrogenase (short-subunit alcohol dehydrogenase family)
LVANVRDPDSIEKMLADIWTTGPLTGLVNNAGANFLAPTETLSPRGYEAIRSTVMDGSFYAAQACGKRWIATGLPGVIISNLVTWVWTGSAYVVPAAMAKAAVHAMTMSLAVEWGPKGIRVNAIAPGPFPTENAWDKINPLAETGVGATQADEVPLRRFGKMDELRNLVIFLMSDGCSYITGDTISIDGGHHLAAPSTFAGLSRPSPEDAAGPGGYPGFHARGKRRQVSLILRRRHGTGKFDMPPPPATHFCKAERQGEACGKIGRATTSARHRSARQTAGSRWPDRRAKSL